MRKLLLLALITVAAGFSQAYYTVAKTTSLTAAAEVITVQATSSSKFVKFIGAYFDCSVACTFTLEKNGTAATATTLLVNPVNPDTDPAATATAWSGSNVGTGTVLGTYTCSGACNLSIDLSAIKLGNSAGTGVNLTLRSSSITGTVDVLIKFSESAT